jgi:hypothetical protein
VVSGVTAVVTAACGKPQPTQMGKLLPLGALLSGWRDLNSRPLDPQIGCRWLSRLNHLSLVSIVDR